jgi:hypothetical protein
LRRLSCAARQVREGFATPAFVFIKTLRFRGGDVFALLILIRLERISWLARAVKGLAGWRVGVEVFVRPLRIADTIVPGSIHYPFLKQLNAGAAGNDVTASTPAPLSQRHPVPWPMCRQLNPPRNFRNLIPLVAQPQVPAAHPFIASHPKFLFAPLSRQKTAISGLRRRPTGSLNRSYPSDYSPKTLPKMCILGHFRAFPRRLGIRS